MTRPMRKTGPLLDVLLRLLRADASGEDLYGWQIMKDIKRSGPTVYGILDRLEDYRWISSFWENLETNDNRPRRRLYRVTAEGRNEIRELLVEWRPDELKRISNSRQAIPMPWWPPGSVAPGGAR